MARETFFHPETETLFKQLEEVSQRSSMSRGQAFEDFLHVTVCALGHPLMEDEYLQTIERHKAGNKGKRGVDKLAEMFATLVDVTDTTRADILGDLFQGAITYGERGQFLTSEAICKMMAQMSLPFERTDLDGRRTVNDPCCGSGRMLLAAAEMQPNWQFVGQDVDMRCVRMTAINLAMRNHYGHVVCGNSLSNTVSDIYETGRVQVWGNAIRRVSRVPLPNREPEQIDVTPPTTEVALETTAVAVEPTKGTNKQLRLF
ncbi:MAG: N-6 DNA methylase [Planctomycetaceae bacterium]